MSPFAIDSEKLAGISALKHGAHNSPKEGMCVMEAVSFVAGEPYSDHPPCACPVIGTFMRSWNDGIQDDDTRTRLLKPFIEKLVGTKSTQAVELRRADLAADFLIRTHAPTWLEFSGDGELQELAAQIRALPPMLSTQALQNALPTLKAAQNAAAAWDAARAAARAAAWAAAWAAVEAAALAKKVDVAGLSYEEAYNAAQPACAALFAPARATLERSALDLIERMLAVTPESLAAEEQP